MYLFKIHVITHRDRYGDVKGSADDACSLTHEARDEIAGRIPMVEVCVARFGGRFPILGILGFLVTFLIPFMICLLYCVAVCFVLSTRA